MTDETSQKSVSSGELKKFAGWVAQNPANDNAMSNFLIRVQTCSDTGILLELANVFPHHPEVSIPVYKRLLDLAPDDSALKISLGYAWWMCGEDEQAMECVREVQNQMPDSVDALMLEAALARDDAAKKALYTKVVHLQPDHRDAFEHLLMLR